MAGSRLDEDEMFFIRVLNRQSGEMIQEVQSQCNHTLSYPQIHRHPVDPGCVLECCFNCEVIRSYNLNTGNCRVVFSKFCVFRICDGSGDTILCDAGLRGILQLEWNKQENKFHVVNTWQKDMYKLYDMSFIKPYGILVLVYTNRLEAVKVGDKLVNIWKSFTILDGQKVGRKSITNDDESVYIGEMGNNSIRVIDSLTGDILNVFHFEENGQYIRPVWSNTDPNLTLVRGFTVANYSLVEKQ